ncbi:MAG: recombination regulator RecX [Oscillospiraceae bacterium]|nr:recombination regulator RecX [Oscillospiraceae bacterium]
MMESMSETKTELFETMDSSTAEDQSLESTKKRALKILGSRQMSAGDMERRLIAKGETKENAQAAVCWLKKIGVIDEAQYAEMICKHYSGKGYGPARIKDELFKRGIPKHLWEDAQATVEASDMDDAAVALLQKKLKGRVEEKDTHRAINALCRRGYHFDVAHLAVKRYVESVEAELQ